MIRVFYLFPKSKTRIFEFKFTKKSIIMFSSEVYSNRRNKLRASVSSGIILVLGNNESPMNYKSNTYHFRQDSTFLYFFGLDKDGLAGVLDIDNQTDYIFGNDVDMDDIIWMGNLPSMKDQAEQVGVKNTAPFNNLSDFLKKAIIAGRKIHFTPPYRTENALLLSNLLGVNYTFIKEYASVELIKAIVKLRSIKDEFEIAEISKAVNTTYLMHTTGMKMAKSGIIEQEIVGVLEGISLSGGNPPSFPIILTVNGQTLHNHNHSNTLSVGRMMVIDAGASTSMHYAGDITRTVPVGGKFNTRQRDIYNAVLNANMAAITACKPGIAYREIHLLACKTLAQNLKEIGLMKGNIDDAIKAGAHALFMPHGLGHMLGLDVHDMEDYGENHVGYDEKYVRSSQFGLAFLRLGRELQKGFVLTVEPGCYFIPALIDQWKAEKMHTDFINYDLVETYKDFGGIRIEDDVLITENGFNVLGKPIPKTVAEIEETMGS